MHPFIPSQMTNVPCLVDLHYKPLIGVRDAGTFVVQSARTESTTSFPLSATQQSIDSKL